MPGQRIQEISFEDEDDGVVVKRKAPRLYPRTRRVRSLLSFPAWVVSNQTRTSHLHLANPVAAYECDGEGAEGLQQGLAYWFAFDVPLEVVEPRLSFWERRDRPSGSHEDYPFMDSPRTRVAYQMLWNPDFDGFHEKGRVVLPRGRGGKERDRHRWDLHHYDNPGAGLRSALRCSDDEVREFAARGSKDYADLHDKETGAPHGKRLPWGFASAVVGGRRLV